VDGAQVDESYLAKTRARLAASGKPAQKRKVAVLDDDLEINRLAGGSNELPLYVKNRNQVCCIGGLDAIRGVIL
jgi:hypothetical protein